ncbi:MAG: PQQ-dependent sugar dehydrogenase [Actinobacteria bacterium]|nr:PQQ-dependent sugar dehydrogenase [Actinomycetota bacterium]
MRRALALAAVAAITLAACSSDTDSSPTVAPPPDVTFAPATTASTSSTSTTVRYQPTPLPTTTTIPLATGAVGFTTFVEGLTKPVDIAFRPDDLTFFVAQQDGLVVPVRDGTGVAGEPVLDVRGDVSNGGEQGLLGLAFHPSKPLAYIDYTDTAGDTQIVEYSVAEDGTFDPASARTVISVDQPYANHNGGEITFGTDGYLYIGLGDGGSANDPERRALNVSQLLGKILRIDPTVSADGQPYTVPADNPFVGVDGARPEIWSVGLRNPWRFDFDPATGDLWMADVGQNAWEEVNVSPASAGAGRGVNFGWSAFEGTHRFNDDQSAEGVTPPVYEYPHGDDGCSVSGGAVYRGSAIPSLVGWYVFSDYCSGKVWALQPDGTFVTLGALGQVSAVADGPDGALYVLAHGEGTLYRLDPA